MKLLKDKTKSNGRESYQVLANKERAERVAKCQNDLEMLLKKYNCALSSVQTIENGKHGPVYIHVTSAE